MTARTRSPRLHTSRASGGVAPRQCDRSTRGRGLAASTDPGETTADATDADLASDANSVREGTGHSDLDAILYDWRRLAALGWYGFVTSGRGVVVVSLGTRGPALGFEPGPPCRCHARWVSAYDPTEEVLIVVRRGDQEWIYRLGGWPTPPEAFGEAHDGDAEPCP